MPDPLLLVLELTLAATFAWAVAAKLMHWSTWTSSLGAYGISGGITPLVAVLVPLAELVVVVLILVGPIRLGLASTLLLVSTFSLGILRARAQQGDKVPCGCFGQTDARDYRVLLVRNGFLGGLAGVALATGATESIAALAEVPAPADILPAVLVGGGAVLASWLGWQVVSMRRKEHL